MQVGQKDAVGVVVGRHGQRSDGVHGAIVVAETADDSDDGVRLTATYAPVVACEDDVWDVFGVGLAVFVVVREVGHRRRHHDAKGVWKGARRRRPAAPDGWANSPTGGTNSQTSTLSRGTQRLSLGKQISSMAQSSVNSQGTPKSTQLLARQASSAVQHSSSIAPHRSVMSSQTATQRSSSQVVPSPQHALPQRSAEPQSSTQRPAMQTSPAEQQLPAHITSSGPHIDITSTPMASGLPPSGTTSSQKPSMQESPLHSASVLQGRLGSAEEQSQAARRSEQNECPGGSHVVIIANVAGSALRSRTHGHSYT